MTLDRTLAVPNNRRGSSQIFPALVVWGSLVLMLFAALAFVWRFGSNVPSWDDWDMVPIMTGHQPVTTEWLWSQHNEHRVPVPKLIGVALYYIFGPDFRVGMYFNVFLFAGLASAMITIAKRLRGRLIYADGFFPVLLLNWAHGVNFSWSWQMEFFLSTVLASLALLIIVYNGSKPRVRTVIVFGLCLIILAMCGAHGVALLPALALWIAYSGILWWQSGGKSARGNAAAIFFIAGLVLFFVALYFIGYQKVPYHPSSSGPIATIKTAVQFFTMGLGPAVRLVWPFSGILVLLIAALALALLALRFRQVPQERIRTLGLGLFMGAIASLALGIGLGRDGFEPRYVGLAVPIWCCMYFVAIVSSPLRVGRILQGVLAMLVCAALWPNAKFGLHYAGVLRSTLGAVERKMSSGISSHHIISKYGERLHPHHDVLNEYMPMLRERRIGSFRYLKKDPPDREVSLPLVPVELNEVKWSNGVAHSKGYAPYIIFNLPLKQYLSGVRITYSYTSSSAPLPYVGVFWRRDTKSEFTLEQFTKHSPTGDKANWAQGTLGKRNDPKTTMTVWTCDTVSQIKILAGFSPGVLTIHEIMLLYPAN